MLVGMFLNSRFCLVSPPIASPSAVTMIPLLDCDARATELVKKKKCPMCQKDDADESALVQKGSKKNQFLLNILFPTKANTKSAVWKKGRGGEMSRKSLIFYARFYDPQRNIGRTEGKGKG